MSYKKVTEWLEEAQDILVERGKDYDGEEERSMGKTIEIFNIFTGHDLKESEGWLLMQILKDVRQWTKDDLHVDSALDSISYCGLKCEALSKEELESR